MEPNFPIVDCARFANIEALNAEFAHAYEGEVTQLTSGSLGGRHSVVVPGLEVHRVAHNAPLMIEESRIGGGVSIGFSTAATKAPKWCGVEVDADGVLVNRSGASHVLMIPACWRGVLINLSPELARELGWSVRSPDGVVLCARRRALLARLSDRWLHGERDVDLRQRLLFALSALFTDGSSKRATACAGFDLVAAARAHVEALPIGAPIVVPEIAAVLQVSERTLERAFKNWSGMGPLRYFTVCRMHRFRRRLIGSDRSRGLVSELAAECGFAHGGHFSRKYRELFGERPLETVRA